ncbi:NAD(P)-dependent dehydrogenase (short-subunit alcohol dehydrogenase family) [Amycolatopsis endophytica]|uniref:NAD(P)-dependent dehydrogenase (Short-subunit alcohol dehydrogenase family) n=1 Tax=Amycolatopsis endophytica TaxID=860233 RepID=A0A853B9Z3_9PSEU|nr:SDR family oxidoreductase [Amycolatopsis endophytica]NYI91810.1 NAD(P)-dependent dehydrogenase (short-subunit alcohol dehydrogenase family) [Amycolatopsis endophytica]
MGQLDGKVALVTGGTAGIGLEMARRFAAEGAQVYLTGRRPEAVDEAVASIGGSTVGLCGDVSDLAALDRVFTTISERSGTLDVLVANAGSGTLTALPEITEELFDSTFGSNVKGLVFTVQKALPLLTDGASIILVASISGITGSPGMSLYAATKAAVRNFARSWAAELAPRRIRVNALNPGQVATPGLARLTNQLGDGAEHLGTLPPLGRIGDATEIAAAALFLATPDTAYMTGSDLVLDGGATI